MAPGDAPGVKQSDSAGILMNIEVVQSLGPRLVQCVVLHLPADATVQTALLATGWVPAEAFNEARLGIWGRKTTLGHPLKAGDRLEIYRPLLVDPKEARRQRYAAKGPRQKISGNRRFKATQVSGNPS